MGFRTTITTEDLSGVKLPKSFVEKWQKEFNFGEHKHSRNAYYQQNTFLISSKFERKMYNGKEEEIIVDIQRVARLKGLDKIILIALHECGGITRFQIEKDKIRLSEPTEWKEVDDITHNYCYGCSDLKKEN